MRHAAVAVRGLLDHVGGALGELGERDVVRARVEAVVEGGTGAARQRRALRDGGLSAVLELVTGAE